MVMDKKYGISILLIILFIYKGSANSSNPASLGLKGDTADVQTITHSGYLLMGGSTDVDVAVKWFYKGVEGVILLFYEPVVPMHTMIICLDWVR